MMSYAEELFKLFAGNQAAHGTYQVQRTTQGGKKIGKADTIREPATVEHWQNHIDGEQGIGIVPIKEDDTCVWGCIDIDEYGINHASLVQRITNTKLPLFVCKTKSGGAHVFAFFEKDAEAESVQGWLRSIAAGLGYGSSEIFPKQTKILKERGDVGNWLNMPYFDYKQTVRYCVAPNGTAVQLPDFLKLAKKSKIDPEKIWDYKITSEEGELEEGPPCLQVLCSNGFPEGTRNNGLFNLGIFARKKHPDQWKEKVEKFNQEYMDPPLSSDEVIGVSKQLEKKDYEYKCNEVPICHYCNSAVCRTRAYGVGAGNAMPTLSGLTKLDTEPPIWFLDVDGKRLELTTDELQQQEKFQRRSMEQLNLMPPKVKIMTWTTIVQKLLENLTIIEQPEDVKVKGVLQELLTSFCTGRGYTEKKEDILRGLPYTEKGITHFQLKDFIRFCRNQGSPFERNWVAARLREAGGYQKQLWVAECNASVWCVPAFRLSQQYELGEPEQPPV